MTKHMKKERSGSKSRGPVLLEPQGCKKQFQDNVNMCFIWLIWLVWFRMIRSALEKHWHASSPKWSYVQWKSFFVYDLKETEIICKSCTNGE